MKICPKEIYIRRTKVIGSDRLSLTPDDDVASIQKIVVNIDETVIIRLLGFHVKDKLYCESFKIDEADKQYCTKIKSQYVHFQLKKEGYATDQSMFFLAFLPRYKTESELNQVVKELCDVIEWLGIRQQANCVVFRFGRPVHRMDNILKWQRRLEETIEKTRNLYIAGRIIGRIKHIREENERCLTISSASIFESINVS